jgi:endonuclease/exonuclease/phosphatase (EEP) superfamily protein YafD
MERISLFYLIALLIQVNCSNSEPADSETTPTTVTVTGVSLDRTNLELAFGSTATLVAMVVPDNADNKSVSWNSSVPAIAHVSGQGEVKAVGIGSSVIGVTTEDGGKTAACTVTVTPAVVPVTGVSLDKNVLSLSVGESETLTATVIPDNATNKSVQWNSNAPEVVSVEALTGRIIAKAAGNAVITAVTVDGDKTDVCLVTVTAESEITLRVMSFNIWMGGFNSIDRTIAVIRDSRADIVGIQEATDDAISAITRALGWYSSQYYVTSQSCAIVSKYPIEAFSASKKGAKIKISNNRSVWMFNVHLDYCPYEPYQLNNIEYCGAPRLQTAEQAIASAKESRDGDILDAIAEVKLAQADQTPIFFTGDFNEPSWLDWTERAVTANLCKIAVEWPTTKQLQEQTGMKDSYRTFYPDEVVKPGYTWTPLPADNEVLDRIDFVFFWGSATHVINSEIVGEKTPESDIVISSFPSDHRAVMSTFRLN